jgi:DNA-binding beta-propeller fold protein YncE
MKTGIVSIGLLSVVGTVLAQSRSTPSPALLVLSKRDRTLSIVDPATLQVVARMPSGPDPHEVAASTDGKLAYVSNYGFGAYNTITVVDLVAQKTLRAIDLGALHGPHGLDYTGGKLYFTAEANKVFGRYDPSQFLDGDLETSGAWLTGRNGVVPLFQALRPNCESVTVPINDLHAVFSFVGE